MFCENLNLLFIHKIHFLFNKKLYFEKIKNKQLLL